MSPSRARREASKRLGIELQNRYRRLVLAGNDPDEVTAAAVELGQLFNDNIEFVIWVLKTYGGLIPPHPERLKKDIGAPANGLPMLPDTWTKLLK